MTTRVLPSETIRAEIDELIAGAERGSLLEHFEDVARALALRRDAQLPDVGTAKHAQR